MAVTSQGRPLLLGSIALVEAPFGSVMVLLEQPKVRTSSHTERQAELGMRLPVEYRQALESRRLSRRRRRPGRTTERLDFAGGDRAQGRY
jgi:hypothetical protein